MQKWNEKCAGYLNIMSIKKKLHSTHSLSRAERVLVYKITEDKQIFLFTRHLPVLIIEFL